MGHVTLDFYKSVISPLIFIVPFKFLSNPLQMLTYFLFYWVAASVATIRSPIATVQNLILTPGPLTNENLCFALLTNQNLEFVALSGCQCQRE
jgi:hypothetical protein